MENIESWPSFFNQKPVNLFTHPDLMAIKITETQKERISRRNNLIRKEFEKLSSKEFKGVRLYSTNYILTKIADQFFLSPSTIEDIVFYRK